MHTVAFASESSPLKDGWIRQNPPPTREMTKTELFCQPRDIASEEYYHSVRNNIAWVNAPHFTLTKCLGMSAIHGESCADFACDTNFTRDVVSHTSSHATAVLYFWSFCCCWSYRFGGVGPRV